MTSRKPRGLLLSRRDRIHRGIFVETRAQGLARPERSHIGAPIVTLICLFAPLTKVIYDFDAISLDARPITNLIHRTGDWALIFLLVVLAVRPLSRILRFNQLLDVRRMIGVGAFAYAAAHFILYIVDLMFDWREIASEIVHRNRLTLSFVALLGLTALAATSTNGMVRRLGIKRWQRLHQAIYLIGLLVLIHYFLRFKLIESEPTLATGLFGCRLGHGVLVWWRKTSNELPTWMLLAMSSMTAALTFIAEAIALGIQANISPLRVLQSAFDFDPIRPGWLVLGAGLIVVALGFVCARRQAAPRRAPGRARARGLTRCRTAINDPPMPAGSLRMICYSIAKLNPTGIIPKGTPVDLG